MPIKAVENRRLYRQIAAQLSALIASGELAVGGKLPAERELAVQLGVSRPSLREAIIALELEGMVEVRVGAGIPIDEFSLECAIDQDGEFARGRSNGLGFADPQGQAPVKGAEGGLRLAKAHRGHA